MSQSHPHRDLIANVAFAAAWCDGGICDQEREVLDKVLTRLGYDASERAVRVDEAARPPEPSLAAPPEDFGVRLEMMRYALAVTLADSTLAEHEEQFLAHLAGHLGISGQALSILQVEAENLVGALPTPDLLRRVEALLPDS